MSDPDSPFAIAAEVRDDVERAIETVTDPVTAGLGMVLDPISSAIRATVGLPPATPIGLVIGIHAESILVPVPPGLVVPVPGVTLFLGYTVPDVIGAAIDFASWAMGSEGAPLPAQGVFWSILSMLNTNATVDGIHAAIAPQGMPLPVIGAVALQWGSQSVDIGSRHAVRWFENGMGCNHPVPFSSVSIDTPFSKFLVSVPTGMPVLIAGTSVLDMGAVISALIAFLRGKILGAFLGFGSGWLEQMAGAVIEELAKDTLDGSVSAESLAEDVAKGMWKGTQRYLRRRISDGAQSAGLDATASTSVRRARSVDEPAFALA